ncbi:MAG TPA: carboxypeptidase-like regulatory domain-containing protein [Chitinophagaceae bacterium]|nr:carboxypeptidase-like regulatory domain-containing protein [Chitinophagaceae bacterium]
MKFFSTFCIALFFQIHISAQNFEVSGIVVDAKTKMPVSGATVFINNTTNFCITNDSGRFTIVDTTDKMFEIVCTKKGYENLNHLYKLLPKKYTLRFEITTAKDHKPAADSLLKKNKEYWESLFLTELLGVESSQFCEVANMDALRFTYIDSAKELHITAAEPLIIFNEKIGYLIHCSFTDFIIKENGNSDNEIFAWYKPLTSKDADVVNRWFNQRESVYENSLLHFMRALYADDLVNQGFNTKFITRIFKTDSLYKRIDKVMRETDTKLYTLLNAAPYKQNNYVDLIDKKIIASSYFRNADSVVSLQFHHKIMEVIYKKKYYNINDSRPLNSDKFIPASYIVIKDNQKIIIEPSGAFYYPTDIVISGYWSEQKLENMLPTDFRSLYTF